MSYNNSQPTALDMQLEIMQEESKMDLNNLEDIFKITYSFDKLQLILKMLLNSQKNHGAHIRKLFEL